MARPLTIIEVTGRLGIGGVEAHVSRLTAELARRGHRPIWLAPDSGGRTARTVNGAELYICPFSKDGLRRAIDALALRTVDIVHAHNYRAARFAAPLSRAIGAKYVMTVHGPRPWWKRAAFRAWSEIVLTVSAADRENITGPFGVSKNRVVIGFLGVDSDRFHPAIDASSLRREWNIAAERPLIVNVTRFTHRKARPALKLIEALPLVRRDVPGVSLALVGDGDQLDRIRREASALNHALGEPAVIVAGPRTDIPTVMNAADVVVATATTATESLACARPTIAFGRTGYFGVVTRDNFEDARAVCFADHGRLPRQADARTLAHDLVSLLSDRKAARQEAMTVRNLIAERYTVGRMVDQIERIYLRIAGDTALLQTRNESGP